jgi:hypothetical protein
MPQSNLSRTSCHVHGLDSRRFRGAIIFFVLLRSRAPMVQTHTHTQHTHTMLMFFFRRLGSLFFPNTNIRGDSARQSSVELYVSVLQAFGQMTKNSPNVSTTELEYRAGKAIFAQSFERSSVLELSGQPSSNSRIISLVSRFSDTAVHDSSFYLFFAQLIRVFSSNAVVEQ